MKNCRKCNQEKPLSEFNKNKNTKDGYQYYCKVCITSKYSHSEYSKKYYQNNTEKVKSKVKEYQINNPEQVKLSHLKSQNKLGAGVYAWINKKTNKIVYIGETKTLSRRKWAHKSDTNEKVSVFAKFNLNPNDYKFIILHKIDDETERKAIEKTLINTLNPVYNQR